MLSFWNPLLQGDLAARALEAVGAIAAALLFAARAVGEPAWEARARAGGFRDDPGFLEGAAGIGLALLAAASPVEPEWDRLLLVSTATAG